MAVRLEAIPPDAAAACARLRDELPAILGDRLVALWAHGARVFPNPPRHFGDVDVFAVLASDGDDAMARDVADARARIGHDHGVELDLEIVLERDARGAAPPRRALRAEPSFSPGWAFVRAHLLAGHYVLLHGLPPEGLVPPPEWQELGDAIERELGHLEAHIAAGDQDAYECSYAILNGARLLYTVEQRDPAISKLSASAWALQHLEPRWHDAITSAARAYDAGAGAQDLALLQKTMAPFVEMVRRRLAAAGLVGTDPRPRWS